MMVLSGIRLEVVKVNEEKELEDAISFTEALTQTKFGKFNYILIFISGMILANVLLENASIGFILPVAQCDLKLTNSDKGILSAIGFIGIIVSSHVWGFLADTKGRRRIIRPTLLAAFVVTIFSSLSQTFWVLVLLRFINGVFISGSSATIYAYLSEFHTDKKRSLAIMSSCVIFSLGGMLLVLFAFLVYNQEWMLPMPLLGIDYKPWRLLFVVCGLPGFLCGLSLYAIPESPKYLLSVGEEKKAIEVLQKMLRWNGGKEELKITHIFADEVSTDALSQIKTNQISNSNFAFVFLQAMWNQTVPLFHKKYLNTTLIVCTQKFWLYLVTNGMYVWYPHIINSMAEFMKYHPGENKKICNIIYDKHDTLNNTDGSMECVTKLENTTYFYSLVLYTLYALAFAFIGLIINRVGKTTLLLLTMIFCSSCGLAVVFVADPSIAVYLYVLLFLVGLGNNILGALTVELYPTSLRATAVGISMMVGRVGSVAGANIIGVFLTNNCEVTFYVACIALLVCGFLSFALPKRNLNEPTKAPVEAT